MVSDIRICKLPYQEHPFVHGVRDGRDVWLTSTGVWSEVDGDPDIDLDIPLYKNIDIVFKEDR